MAFVTTIQSENNRSHFVYFSGKGVYLKSSLLWEVNEFGLGDRNKTFIVNSQKCTVSFIPFNELLTVCKPVELNVYDP